MGKRDFCTRHEPTIVDCVFRIGEKWRVGQDGKVALIRLLVTVNVSIVVVTSAFIVIRFSSSACSDARSVVIRGGGACSTIDVVGRCVHSSDFYTISSGNGDLCMAISGSAFNNGTKRGRAIELTFSISSGVLFVSHVSNDRQVVISGSVAEVR